MYIGPWQEFQLARFQGKLFQRLEHDMKQQELRHIQKHDDENHPTDARSELDRDRTTDEKTKFCQIMRAKEWTTIQTKKRRPRATTAIASHSNQSQEPRRMSSSIPVIQKMIQSTEPPNACRPHTGQARVRSKRRKKKKKTILTPIQMIQQRRKLFQLEQASKSSRSPVRENKEPKKDCDDPKDDSSCLPPIFTGAISEKNNPLPATARESESGYIPELPMLHHEERVPLSLLPEEEEMVDELVRWSENLELHDDWVHD